MVDTTVENFVFWFSRTQENAFIYVFLQEFAFVPQMFFVHQKSGGGSMAHPAPSCVSPNFWNCSWEFAKGGDVYKPSERSKIAAKKL